MDAKELKKIDGILKILDNFIIPLAEQGAAATKNPIDDLVVASLKGAIVSAKKKIEEMMQQQSTS